MVNSRIQLGLWPEHRLSLERNIILLFTTIIQDKIIKFKTLILLYYSKKDAPNMI